ncbi:EpsI family protein [bacterium]|nr:EpsI family protein [bacterium]
MAAAIRVRLVLLVVIGACLGLGPALAARSGRHVYRAQLATIPLSVGDITGVASQLDDEIADVLKASQTLNRNYRRGDDRYWLFVGYFAQQRFGSQIHSPRHCYPGSGWNILSAAKGERLGGPSGELLIQRDKDQRVVLYQYLTRSGATTSELRLKVELTLGGLLGRPLDAAFIRYSTPVGPEESAAAAMERLGRFAREVQPTVRPGLPF